MKYLIQGQVTQSFNWWQCGCFEQPMTTSWGGEVTLGEGMNLNVSPLPATSWTLLEPAKEIDGQAWLKAIDLQGAKVVVEGTTLVYDYSYHHANGWHAVGTLIALPDQKAAALAAPVPEPSVGLLMVAGLFVVLLSRRLNG